MVVTKEYKNMQTENISLNNKGLETLAASDSLPKINDDYGYGIIVPAELTFCHTFLKDNCNFEINIQEILTRKRGASLTFQRALCAHIMRKRGLVLENIGAILGRTHATVINLLAYGTKKQARDGRYWEFLATIQTITVKLPKTL